MSKKTQKEKRQIMKQLSHYKATFSSFTIKILIIFRLLAYLNDRMCLLKGQFTYK